MINANRKEQTITKGMEGEYLRLYFVRQMKRARMACTETQQLKSKFKQDRDLIVPLHKLV